MTDKFTRRRPWAWLTICLWVLTCSNALALNWSDLTESERNVLAPFEEQWPELAEDSQEKLRIGAQRWDRMSGEQRTATQNRFARWQQLEPKQRKHIRQRYQTFKSLPAQRQRQLRRAHEHFKSLPRREQAALRRQFRAMTPPEKQAFLKGVDASKEAAEIREIKQEVNAEQQAELRERLRDLKPSTRRQVVKLMREIDAPQRMAFRNRILSMSAAELETYMTSEAKRDFE